MADNNFLGTGIKFPIQVNPATGRFVSASGAESVKESVYLILMTQRTERFIKPWFGSKLMSYTFIDVNEMTLADMKRDIRNTILKQEPRIAEADVEITAELKKGMLLVDISYTIADSYEEDNLVFPFYLMSAPEGEGSEYD